jgi:hypothetical protein
MDPDNPFSLKSDPGHMTLPTPSLDELDEDNLMDNPETYPDYYEDKQWWELKITGDLTNER